MKNFNRIKEKFVSKTVIADDIRMIKKILRLLSKVVIHFNNNPKRTPFQKNGFVIHENFLDSNEITQLKIAIENEIATQSIEHSKRKSKDKTGDYDVNFYDIDLLKIDFKGKNILIKKIEQKMLEVIECRHIRFDAINLYKTENLSNPRCYHVDSYSHRYIKGFIYLKDVTLDDGPYSYLKSSHNSIFRKTLNLLFNFATKSELTDFRLFNNSFEKQVFCSSAGTLIISDQLGAHAGTNQKPGRNREMLSFGFIAE